MYCLQSLIIKKKKLLKFKDKKQLLIKFMNQNLNTGSQ